MRQHWILLAFSLAGSLLLLHSCTQQSQENLPEAISYNFHIRPLLSDKCFKCHGPDTAKLEAGLRLDIASAAYAPLKESKGKFAIVPGKPELSELILRIRSTDSTEMMPPPDAHLGMMSKAEVALFEKWIAQGAKYEPHWAFVAPVKKTPPTVKDEEWNKQPIDQFVAAAMTKQGLDHNEEEEPAKLLKRLSFDLTGLPPSMAQMEVFEKDHSDATYEKMVNQMLASPQYGEKMTLHWLDVGRYADSYGYQDDNIRTQWPWRDWVIHAFNQNMPYNQFITWQIAGDMLPNANKEMQLATAFFRNHKYTEEGGVIDEEYRVEYLIDKVKTYSKGMLGLTVECAQCHDHKYDPVSQKDYFSMFAFFNNTYEVGYEGDVSISKPAKNPVMPISKDDVKNILSFINQKDSNMLTVSVLGERDSTRKTYVLNRGVYNLPSSTVAEPEALPAVMKYDVNSYPRNRVGLAKWTVDRRNPLTARVFVNQVWQEFFGRGIVKTSGDFGMQGELPSHPQLLDWLAVDFMENGWNIKRLVKQIVMSATYRQSNKVSKTQLEKDPENIYLSRSPRIRLKAEFIKDMLMASSGLLNPEVGGPSVKPYQPKGIWETASSGRGELATYKQDKGPNLYRRGMYTFIKLTVPPPSMAIFDASNRDQCEVKRLKTGTPLQALVMLNDPTSLEASRVLAQQLLANKGTDENRISTAFQRIICRKASAKEMDILQAYLQAQRKAFTSKQLNADKTLAHGEYPLPANANKPELAAWMKLCSTIYNMEEAITK
ncbi:PSD1 and planctomycete cytochrome C domain-containing protein [Phnomibacter sp. MR]|uniref:PSD1 and planctomycete cytochrome C domain-containing protein n=1 Tax=Phnomibacter sp. MR TaxID=3042318 RepID=UPI003A804A45